MPYLKVYRLSKKFIMDYSKMPAPDRIESPSWRGVKVLEHYNKTGSSTEWGCSYMNSFNRYLAGIDRDSYEGRAYSLYYIPAARSSINALLFSNAPLHRIANDIEEEELTVLAYSKLFFDTSVFPNKLVKLAFVRQMPSSNPQEDFEKNLMISAIQLGSEYISWKLGLSENNGLDPGRVYSSIMADSFWKFKEMKIKNNMDISRESRAWVPSIITAATNSLKINKQLASDAETVKIKLLSVANNIPLDSIKSDLKG